MPDLKVFHTASGINHILREYPAKHWRDYHRSFCGTAAYDDEWENRDYYEHSRLIDNLCKRCEKSYRGWTKEKAMAELYTEFGDSKPLYRIDFDAFAAWVQRRHRSPIADDAGIISVLRAEGILCRMWPKETDDDS